MALDFNGGNLNRTAQELSIPRKTLAEWARSVNQCHDVAKIRQLRGGDLADRLEKVIRHTLDSLTPEVIAKARFIDRIRAVGLFVDKMLQLRGCRCGAAQGRRGLRRVA